MTSHLSQWLSSINQQTVSAGEYVEKGEYFVLLVAVQTGTAVVKSSMEIPQKIKNRPVFWPSNPTPGNILEGTQNINLKEHSIPMFIAVLFTIAKNWKQPKCLSRNEWIK